MRMLSVMGVSFADTGDSASLTWTDLGITAFLQSFGVPITRAEARDVTYNRLLSGLLSGNPVDVERGIADLGGDLEIIWTSEGWVLLARAIFSHATPTIAAIAAVTENSHEASLHDMVLWCSAALEDSPTPDVYNMFDCALAAVMRDGDYQCSSLLRLVVARPRGITLDHLVETDGLRGAPRVDLPLSVLWSVPGGRFGEVCEKLGRMGFPPNTADASQSQVDYLIGAAILAGADDAELAWLEDYVGPTIGVDQPHLAHGLRWWGCSAVQVCMWVDRPDLAAHFVERGFYQPIGWHYHRWAVAHRLIDG
jgi:hypothetical protein